MPDIDPETTLTPGVTAEELVAEFEGEVFDALYEDSDEHFLCDYCSKGVSFASEPEVAWYIADDVLDPPVTGEVQHIKENRPLVPLAVYCPEHANRMLYFPCEGFAEARVVFSLDADRVMHDLVVTDHSPRDDGIPWDPRELSERVTGVPFAENALMAPEELWGPENMVTFFLAIDTEVDLRELIQWDGTLDPKLLGQARKQWENFAKEMRERYHDERSFSRYVRGKE